MRNGEETGAGEDSKNITLKWCFPRESWHYLCCLLALVPSSSAGRSLWTMILWSVLVLLWCKRGPARGNQAIAVVLQLCWDTSACSLKHQFSMWWTLSIWGVPFIFESFKASEPDYANLILVLISRCSKWELHFSSPPSTSYFSSCLSKPFWCVSFPLSVTDLKMCSWATLYRKSRSGRSVDILFLK